jgi:hypothetical protein
MENILKSSKSAWKSHDYDYKVRARKDLKMGPLYIEILRWLPTSKSRTSPFLLIALAQLWAHRFQNGLIVTYFCDNQN